MYRLIAFLSNMNISCFKMRYGQMLLHSLSLPDLSVTFSACIHLWISHLLYVMTCHVFQNLPVCIHFYFRWESKASWSYNLAFEGNNFFLVNYLMVNEFKDIVYIIIQCFQCQWHDPAECGLISDISQIGTGNMPTTKPSLTKACAYFMNKLQWTPS